jgi:hypothetical protein
MATIAKNTDSHGSTVVESTGEQLVPYEQRLDRDGRWALSEGSQHFQGTSEVQKALLRICKRLSDLDVPYALVGGMAMFQYGYRRFTEDVDILVTREGLDRIHEALDGLGYVRPFSQSKNLRDVEAGVRVEFLIAGQFPGDGKPKPVAFPDPALKAIDVNGIKVLDLATLVELKLASGMTNIHRLKDLADVQELSKYVTFPANFAQQLDPYVRDKFIELCSNIVPAELESEESGNAS